MHISDFGPYDGLVQIPGFGVAESSTIALPPIAADNSSPTITSIPAAGVSTIPFSTAPAAPAVAAPTDYTFPLLVGAGLLGTFLFFKQRGKRRS